MKITRRFKLGTYVVLALTIVLFMAVTVVRGARRITIVGALERHDAMVLSEVHEQTCRTIGWTDLKQAIVSLDPKAAFACLPYFTSRQQTQITVQTDGRAFVEQFYDRTTPSGQSISAIYQRQGEHWVGPH